MFQFPRPQKVILLGAGASVDFHPKEPPGILTPATPEPFPLSNNFFQKAVEYGVIKEENTFEKLFKFIREEFGVTYIELREGKPLNVEEVYMRLDSKANKLLKEKGISIDLALFKVLSVRSDLLSIIEKLFTQLCRYYEPCRYHAMLADYIVNTNSTVISFNWDILIDEALHNTNKWFYCTGYGFEFKRMYKDKKEFKCDGTKSRELLLKPHGSINWFRYMDFVTNTKNGFTGEKVSDGDKKDTYLFEFSRRFNNLSKVRMHPVEKKLNLGANYSPRLKMPAEIDIVPPGTKYDRSNHGKIWKQVEKSIAEADEIIAIGFALKDDSKEDKEEIEIFKRARKAHKKLLLKIVGKSLELDEKRDELMGRYKKIFSPNKTEFKFSSFKDYCKNIKMH